MSYQVVQNQYFLSKEEPKQELPTGWATESIAKWKLYFDPKIGVHKIGNENAHIIFLGFAFHIKRPKASQLEILENILENREDPLDYLDDLCGRFLILIENNGRLNIYHDASSSFKVFYRQLESEIDLVGYDPKILSHFFDLPKDDSEETNKFYSLKKFKLHSIKLGNKSSYLNVFQLMPSHFLDLDNSKVTRIFPRKKIIRYSVDEAVKLTSLYFSNVIKAANDRFPKVNMTITAGWDSKVLLSHVKDIKDDIHFYLFNKSNLKDDDVDFVISKRIVVDNSLDFAIYDVTQGVDENVKKNVESSFSFIGKQNLEMTSNGITNFDPDEVLILGYLSEITKNFYEGFDVKDEERFCFCAKLPFIQYCKNHFKEYLEENKNTITSFGYEFNDIAHWEQDITNFAASRMSIYNTYINAFSPFNSRTILSTILGVDKKYRAGYTNVFFKELVKYNWPELNEYPVNPTKSKQLITLKKKLGVYGIKKELDYLRYRKKQSEA